MQDLMDVILGIIGFIMVLAVWALPFVIIALIFKVVFSW